MDFIMEDLTFGKDLVIWILFIELPVFFSTLAFFFKTTNKLSSQVSELDALREEKYIKVQESLLNLKLEISHQYASIRYLNAVEKRLTDHLIRIEKKLDEVR